MSVWESMKFPGQKVGSVVCHNNCSEVPRSNVPAHDDVTFAGVCTKQTCYLTSGEPDL